MKDFSRLYSRKAHVHHYTNFMEREEFDQAFETVNSLIKDYIHLDMLQPGCLKRVCILSILEHISLSCTVLGHPCTLQTFSRHETPTSCCNSTLSC